jgi:spermidine synthase
MPMGVPDTGFTLHSSDRWCRMWLSVLVMAWGAQAIVTQSLLLREALVLMFGSEFAWGVVLFAWLLGVAVGAAFGGWLAERLRRTEVGLVAVLLALSVAACVELWVFRGTRAWLGVEPGELLPLPKTALAAMLFVSPASALVGMAFPLACCIGGLSESCGAGPPSPAPDRTRSNNVGLGGPTLPGSAVGRLLQFGHVYALESAGSLIGGAAFSFWAVEHLTPIQTALTCAAVTAAAAGGLLATTPARGYARAVPSARAFPPASAGKRRRLPAAPAGLAAIGAAAVLVAVFGGDALNHRLVDRRWRNVAPGYELVAETESKYQNLAIGHRAGQFTLYCDGKVSADFPDPYTFVPLAHFWLCQHPEPRQVLVLGGGAEGLLAEILRHPIERIDYVEPDPRQIELVEPYLAEADRQALRDPRVTVHHVDARYYVKTQRARFDLVIARLPEPTSALRARFYTDEFYGELRRAMTARSVLCMTVTAAPGELSPASREYLASVRATLRRRFPHLVVGWGDPAQMLAASAPGLTTIDPDELARRYAQRGVKSELFIPEWFGSADWLEPVKLARRAADLDEAQDVQISTDLRPSVYMLRLLLWEAMTAGGVGPGRSGGGMIESLRNVSLAGLVAALAVAGGLTLLVCRLRRRARDGWASGAIVLSVGTTGFATMALSIVWLFAFQNLYGYVYQRIGWIIALFMAGLVIGCMLAQRVGASSAKLWRRLIGVDLLLAILALAIPFLLPMLAALQTGPRAFALVEWCVSIGVVLTGLLGGAAFPLAGRLQLGFSGRVGAAAGSVVSADHGGACLGALLCGILLVPVFGTATAAFLLGGVKLASAGLLVVGHRCARVH